MSTPEPEPIPPEILAALQLARRKVREAGASGRVILVAHEAPGKDTWWTWEIVAGGNLRTE